MHKVILISSLAIISFLTACAEIEPKPFVPSAGHIDAETQAVGEIPELVTDSPVLPEPAPAAQLEKYTVVVNEVPVKELLFALARDAQVNVDIDPTIQGVVTINAIDQTLPQILDRVARQVDLRYEFDGDNLYIKPDAPFLRNYVVDYVNLSRDTSSTNTVSTQISSASGGGDTESGGSSGGSSGNTSTTDVTTESTHHFWERLVSNISAILGSDAAATNTVIPNPESGIITVRATSPQHEQIQVFIDLVVASAKRQVLIQTTIVEVTLSEQYQAGIEWELINQGGINIISSTLAGAPVVGALSSFLITAEDDTPASKSLNATVSLLDEFGDTRILSSPQIMVLNNQTALLKVVENFVYFEIDAETTAGALGAAPVTTVDTTAKTVPVGIVMSVTPQVDANGVITLNVRPTISRVVDTINDPNPNLIIVNAGTTTTLTNPVPQIAVREMESVLRMNDGQIGVLGGLMQDQTQDDDAGIPGLKDKGFFGNLFKTTAKQYAKTELVIFLRPIIIADPSIEGDLRDYKQYLTPPKEFATPATQPTGSEAN